MKVAFRISSFCSLFFLLIFLFLAPAASKEQLTDFWMCVCIISGVLLLVSMTLTTGFLLLFDLEEFEQSLERF